MASVDSAGHQLSELTKTTPLSRGPGKLDSPPIRLAHQVGVAGLFLKLSLTLSLLKVPSLQDDVGRGKEEEGCRVLGPSIQHTLVIHQTIIQLFARRRCLGLEVFPGLVSHWKNKTKHFFSEHVYTD